MKAITEKIRHYYKYKYTNFEQPTLSNNGVFGGDSMAAYHAFGGNNGCWGTTYTAFQPHEGRIGFYCDEWKSSMYICIYFPKPIRLTGLNFYVPHTSASGGGAYNTLLYGGYGANDRRELIRNIGTVGENSWCSVELTSPNYYQYYTLYFENGGWAYEDEVQIMHILFSGIIREITEGTEEDYDFYKDVAICRVIKENNIRQYYKYEDEIWTQPILSGNGTMGGSSAAASASNSHGSYDGQPWRAFNGLDSSSTGWASENAAPPQWIMFYNPTEFQLQSFTIINRCFAWTNFTVQGSNDGVHFDDIETFTNSNLENGESWSKTISAANQKMYKYYRFYLNSTKDNNSDVLQIKLYGIVRHLIEGTPSDYVFYKDIDKYYAVKY